MNKYNVFFLFLDLLEQPISNDEPKATQKAKHLYRSCVNECNYSLHETLNHMIHHLYIFLKIVFNFAVQVYISRN